MIRLVPGTTDTEAAARIRRVVWRWLYVDVETIEHFRTTLPRFRDWLALLDGEPVGIGACGLLPGEEESAAAFALNTVLPEARGRGVGTAVYRQVSEHARSLGKSELQTFGFEDDPGGVAFAEHHGFVVAGRTRALRLLLDGCPRPATLVTGETVLLEVEDGRAESARFLSADHEYTREWIKLDDERLVRREAVVSVRLGADID